MPSYRPVEVYESISGHPRFELIFRVVEQHFDPKHQLDPFFKGLHCLWGKFGLTADIAHPARIGLAGKGVGSDRNLLAELDPTESWFRM